MTKKEALIKVKELREEINNTPGNWTNYVVYCLDQASDVIENAIATESSP